jgi:hypothetical protein
MSKKNRRPGPANPNPVARERWAVKHICRTALMAAVLFAAALASRPAFEQWAVYASNCVAIQAQKEFALEVRRMEMYGPQKRSDRAGS